MVTNNKLVVNSTTHTCLGDAPRLWNQAPKSPDRQKLQKKKQENTVKLFKKIEASYLDWINMTEKMHTDVRERWNLTERLHLRTLTIEHDRNMDEYDQKYIKSLRWQTWTSEFDQNKKSCPQKVYIMKKCNL